MYPAQYNNNTIIYIKKLNRWKTLFIKPRYFIHQLLSNCPLILGIFRNVWALCKYNVQLINKSITDTLPTLQPMIISFTNIGTTSIWVQLMSQPANFAVETARANKLNDNSFRVGRLKRLYGSAKHHFFSFVFKYSQHQ